MSNKKKIFKITILSLSLLLICILFFYFATWPIVIQGNTNDINSVLKENYLRLPFVVPQGDNYIYVITRKIPSRVILDFIGYASQEEVNKFGIENSALKRTEITDLKWGSSWVFKNEYISDYTLAPFGLKNDEEVRGRIISTSQWDGDKIAVYSGTYYPGENYYILCINFPKGIVIGQVFRNR